MCLPSLQDALLPTREKRSAYASQLAREGKVGEAEAIIARDKLGDVIEQQQKKVEALIAKNRLAPDAADAVMRKTGTSPIQQPVTGKNSRRNSFLDGPSGLKTLLGGK